MASQPEKGLQKQQQNPRPYPELPSQGCMGLGDIRSPSFCGPSFTRDSPLSALQTLLLGSPNPDQISTRKTCVAPNKISLHQSCPCKNHLLLSKPCPLKAERVGHRLQNSPDSPNPIGSGWTHRPGPPAAVLNPTSVPLAIPFPRNALSCLSSHPNFTSSGRSLTHWLLPPFLLRRLVSAGKSLPNSPSRS